MPASPALAGVINLPFREQIDFFRQKLNLPTERWDDIWQAAHDRAFVVAGAARADLLNDLRQAVDRVVQGGTTLEAFRREFRDIVARNGWTGWTGEGTRAGEAWRTRVIYETNLRTSYAAGRWQQLTDPALLQLRPWWRYVHSDLVQRPRPHHKRWGDMRLTLRHDHPWWRTHFPPNGWGCRCRVVAESAPPSGAVTEPPDGWDTTLDTTGAPPGIDKGWAYAPGASVADELRKVLTGKIASLPPDLGNALADDMADVLPKPFEPQRTAAAAAKWAVDNDLVDFADCAGVKPEVANAWNESLFDHLRQFPALRAQQRFAGTGQAQFKRYATLARQAFVERLVSQGISEALARKLAEQRIKQPRVNGNTYAHSWMQKDVSGIAVNAKFGASPEAFKAALARDVKSGWHPPGCDTIRSVVDHELAHQLDALLNLRVDSEMLAVYNEARKSGIDKEVSGYASKNIEEFIAEAWAEFCNNPTPRSVARAVAAIVRARYRSRFPAGAGS